MKLQISFRQALWGLLVLLMAGLLTLVSGGLFGLHQQGRAFSEVAQTASRALDMLALEAKILQLELQRENLQPSALADLQQGLDAVPVQLQQVLGGYPALQQQSEVFLQQLQQTLKTQLAFGLNATEGAQGELGAAAVTLMDELTGLAALVSRFADVRNLEKDFFITPGSRTIQAWQEGMDAFDAHLQRIGFHEDFAEHLQVYRDASARLIRLRLDLEQQTGILLEQRQQLLVALHQQAREAAGQQLQQAEQRAEQQAGNQQRMILVSGLLVTLLLVLTVVLLNRRLHQRLKELLGFLQQVAEGDLRQRLSIRNQRDEFDQLAQGVNQTVESLTGLVGGLQASNRQLLQMATAMEEQIGGLQQEGRQLHGRSDVLAAAMEEISATTDQMALAATDVEVAAGQTDQAANQGGQVIQQAIEALEAITARMQDIDERVSHLGEHSQQIGGVLELINGIAEQTNLLALNAAIEAARVGEAGRGFAVVADEIRTLAEQTAQATHDIGGRIDGIRRDTDTTIHSVEAAREQVRLGRSMGREALLAVQGIQQASRASSEKMNQVRSSVAEVAETTSSMTSDMDQVAGLVSQQQARVETLLDATRQLHRQADDLTRDLQRFQI
ncbi:methyl-accepting chemotaxis protein [Marinospirillum alkaliphilum]|uniref:Methyl-accepting chemotaxis protein n=1 Tax=Marinospirillum alkaliphilum DSM 21637 TaxID=1122209 RepID=A0A1K1XYB9_9GAMM|nr:methyl-accepting chemotaxis protein [Marinospirillum alkaliphilum]SFX54036.1 Methyl-accepting chemotaxis protein [Marinospirillum alkaliphilum DSM 21637]